MAKSIVFYRLYIAESALNHGQVVVRKEDKILAEMEELKKLHGDRLPPYKYRLWAEMIVRAQFIYKHSHTKIMFCVIKYVNIILTRLYYIFAGYFPVDRRDCN